MERNRKAKEAYAKEWEVIMSKYPRFARAHLAQQAILMEAALSGDLLVVRRMCLLLEREVVPLFNGFWLNRSDEMKSFTKIFGTGNELLDCLLKEKDPAKCITLPKEDWFSDPFDVKWGLVPQPHKPEPLPPPRKPEPFPPPPPPL